MIMIFWVVAVLLNLPGGNFTLAPADLCEDGGRQRDCDGGAGHAGRGRTGNATQRLQEDLPQHERAKLPKCQCSLFHTCPFVTSLP